MQSCCVPKIRAGLVALLLTLGGLLPFPVTAATYFVDFTGGLDTNNGTASGTAWKNVSKVNSTTFAAGDIIQFKRGETWSGTELVIDSTGASGNPITYQPYGSGAAPIIQPASSHQTSGFSTAIRITGDWNIVDGFLARYGHQSAIQIDSTGNNNIVRNCEVTAAGTGVWVTGSNNTITGNYAHDLLMIADINLDSDYGGVGYWVDSSSNVTFTHNTCIDCNTPSVFFGTDGGCFEFGNSAGGTNITITYNWCENTNGFLETGQGLSWNNVTIAYNVIINPIHSPVMCLHDDSTFSGWVFHHNTVYAQRGDSSVYRVFTCFTGQTPVSVVNNIFVSDVQIAESAQAPTTHTQNRYYMNNQVNGSGVGYTLGTGETTGNPLFVDGPNKNYHLQSGSPARDVGANLGYTLDYDGVSVPQNGTPDLGAYEFVVAATPAPMLLRIAR